MDRFGFNLGYVDDLYEKYRRDPRSVPEVWQEFFADRRQPTADAPRSDAQDSDAPDSDAPDSDARGSDARDSDVRGTARAEKGAPVAAPVGQSPSPPASRDATRAPTSGAPAAVTAETEVDAVLHEPHEFLRGAAARIVENMESSLGVPTATSARTMPVKLLEENRRLINQHQEAAALPKVSFTHIIAWAILRALEEHPALNARYETTASGPIRVRPESVALGLAIDVERRDGTRSLLVPNIPRAERLDFAGLLEAYGDLVDRARRGKLTLEQFRGTTVTITNPGMIGTVLSVPRLMAGQGAIFGIGAIGFTPEFAGVAPGVVAQLGVSRVMTVTSTYDHRIIQGAESGALLATVERLLLGGDKFYERIFADLDIAHAPLSWVPDTGSPLGGERDAAEQVAKQARVLQLIHAYRVRGHLVAHLDPLGTRPPPHPELELSHYGLCLWDLDRRFYCGNLAGQSGMITLRTILDLLRETYCLNIGAEYMHIAGPVEREWLQRHMESTRNHAPMEVPEKLRILEQLNAAEAFERFLHATYVGHKRFSLEGAETLIPVLHALFESAAARGVEDVVMGMAHRGRLNVLANIVGKPVRSIFAEFEDIDERTVHGSGDVKYHLGAEGTVRVPEGRSVRVTLASNPSHLESVDPVVEGMVRARQDLKGDTDHRRTLPVLLHGDAAFAGQGVVFETLNLSQLTGYRTGGTVHVVINNQIGFTTGVAEARSSHYCTDVAKAVGAPILHVNGDHPQAAVRAIRLALEYRQQFGKDVVVDLICYRRWGHNEGDEPAFTQPVLYERIEQQRSVRKLATERLMRRGEIDGETAERMLEDFRRKLEEGHAALEEARRSERAAQSLPDREAEEGEARPSAGTGVEERVLRDVLGALQRTPEGFEPHPKLVRQLRAREDQVAQDRIPWALAELLAFGSVLLEGVPVRVSGQDTVRGTFSQRHAYLYDRRTGAGYCSLQHLAPAQGRFQIYNSSLSEFGVLGFEYGYSVEHTRALVLWEAQFGDFVNGAQVILDQYLASAEEKWGQQSSLVLLLPHGFEGQGPEHSSARLERFLQLCSEGNLRVAYPSTPAQYFHLLRRQALVEERKPLIVMTPKSLLRHPDCVSALAQLSDGRFQEVIDDPDPPEAGEVRRLVLGSGKVVHDLLRWRREHAIDGVAIARVEQFYPFPGAAMQALLDRWGAAAEVIWVQEEPRNMGAWDFMEDRLRQRLCAGQRLHYVGRAWSASPASGSAKRHQVEQETVLSTALTGVLQGGPTAPAGRA